MLPTVSSSAKAVEKLVKVELETPIFRAPKKRRRAEHHQARPDPVCNDEAATTPRKERKRRSASNPERKRRKLFESADNVTRRKKRSSSHSGQPSFAAVTTSTPATGAAHPGGIDLLADLLDRSVKVEDEEITGPPPDMQDYAGTSQSSQATPAPPKRPSERGMSGSGSTSPLSVNLAHTIPQMAPFEAYAHPLSSGTSSTQTTQKPYAHQSFVLKNIHNNNSSSGGNNSQLLFDELVAYLPVKAHVQEPVQFLQLSFT
ncbi:hypothetical protein DdX_14641 [Ditylenchus destructor]|uniref:Uncharacterized protein n=1 Tax=Ditylenchus destructor TaxID=166010 RepID=A0AAD4QYE3_9BILA|nr:hypothetical protein DdX_14641 [Ditylenchus destructor]